MKFNPVTRRLYTDDLALLKTLECRSLPRWDAPAEAANISDRTCATCSRVVVDTSCRTDEAMVELLDADPTTCVTVTLDQPNITVIPHDPGV